MSTSTPPPVVAASSSTSKKPTFVPLSDARSLLRPKRSTIDYNEPRLSSSSDSALHAPPQVMSSSKMTPVTTTLPAAPGASSTFSFDNHTQESASYTDINVTTTQTTSSASQPSSAPGTEATAKANSSTTTQLDAHGGQYTILRIKRKRNEEPLDMLVVQELLSSSGKKVKTLDDQADNEVNNTLAGAQTLPKTVPSADSASSSATSTAASPAIFRFAATVNEASFKDPAQSIQLRDRITQIQNDPSSASPSPSSSRPRSRLGVDRPDRRSIIGGSGGSASGGALTPTPSSQARGELAGKMQSEAKMARYRVVQKNRTSLIMSDSAKSEASSSSSSRASTAWKQGPPEVKSAAQAEAEAALNMFNMIDAVKEEPRKTKKQLEEEAIESDIMCNFLPMVKEYLSLTEKQDPNIVPEEKSKENERRKPASRLDQLLRETGQESDDDDDEDEYVYDIYYRDMNADQTQASQYRSVGSLLWYDDDGEENFIHEEDSSGDDYEDSDSNAEDYYMNDYPEEEDSDQYAYELSDTDDEYVY
ncbi:hypothetical protein BGW41_002627 [Actinomortierella wolfii]|nr:hypothetical protein BGW41_002627 [Actinomortierella wolfii]